MQWAMRKFVGDRGGSGQPRATFSRKKEMQAKRNELERTGLGGQSLDSLAVAEYLKVLDERSSRPESSPDNSPDANPNSSPDDRGDQSPRFSRTRTPTQPRNLVTLHNLAVDNLAVDNLAVDNLAVDNLVHADSTGGLEFFTQKDWRGEVDTWAGMDTAMEALAAAGKRGSTDSAIRAVLTFKGFSRVDQATVDLARESIDALRNTPTNYFEVKPQRAVGLGEFRGAVVPRGVDPQALAVLEKHGIEVVQYGKGEGARDKAIASLSKRLDKANKDVLFARKEGAAQAAPDIEAAIAQETRTEVERWQERLRAAQSNPQAKEPSMATPAVLRMMGSKAAKLVLPRTYLKAIQQKHADVPASVFSELPALLADPLFIIPHRDGGVRVFVDAQTSRGEPIAVGVSVGADGRIHTVTPMHDHDDMTGQSRMKRAVLNTRGRIYARNKEALDGSRASAAAAPGTIPLHRGVSHRVTRRLASVTTRAAHIKRRKQIWEALHPKRFESVWEAIPDAKPAKLEVSEVVPPQVDAQSGKHGGARPQKRGFAASTAAVTGESNRALMALGPRKLSQFFDANEVAQLKAVGKVGQYATAQPAVSAVNNSNSGNVLMGRGLDLLDRLSAKVPLLGLGPTVSGAMREVQQRQAQQIAQALARKPAEQARQLPGMTFGALMMATDGEDRAR